MRSEKIKKYKDKIKVYNLDGIRLLRRLEKHKRKNSYFIFLDPPYYQKGKSLYLNHYDDRAHRKLARFLAATSLKWIMTYDDTPFISNLYDGLRKTKFTIQHSAYISRKGNEVMIFADSMNV